ncbi:hypothetical protein [Actinomadura atramentaria]|uniref:hypothetical protein n=1 Tax=Actinomadura atramentaria TaxID=1990 RepID=UPI000368921E|nr:hypothetical protein [Actinomadura atramentaria]
MTAPGVAPTPGGTSPRSTPTAPGTPAPTTTPSVAASFRPADPRVRGLAGIAPSVGHDGVWWALAGTAGAPRLYALGPDGRTRAVYALSGVPAGVALDALTAARDDARGPRLYLADLSQPRGTIGMYEVVEPTALKSGTLPVRKRTVRYPDGAHAAGTLLSDPRDGRVYVLARTARATALYALPGALGPQVNDLTRMRVLAFRALGAGMTAQGRVVLRTAADVRVLASVRGDVEHVLRVRVPAAHFALDAAGERAVFASAGARPVFRSVALPAAAGGDAPVRPDGGTGRPVPVPGRPALPGGPLGTAALGGLALLGALSLGLGLRNRRRVRRRH